ncbi:MAG: GDSL-type esterase/lipase family protein [Acidobacteria bacterium]|nr:GDSL-type esterase/lipase family protein [Acidobacteriota bacterium]
MKNKGLVLAAAVFALLLCAQARAQGPANWQYTALGDSLAAGTGDAQGGYVPRYRDHLQTDTGRPVTLIDRGVPGWTSTDLLDALRNDPSMRAQVASSQVVTFNIGGNDLLQALQRYQAGTCGGPDNQQCLGEASALLKSNWNAIIAQVLSLRSNSDTIIRTMDIYNPVVNLLKFFGVFEQVKPYLDDINRHIHLTATANRIHVARVYREFNGPKGDEDAGTKGYISSDGIHPSPAGHVAVARLLRELSYHPLSTTFSPVRFAAPVFIAVEGEPRATVRLTRLNSDVPVFVDFTTADDPAAVPCPTANGTAYARCDYATTVETVLFERGEAEKTITIPVFNDSHVEGTERFPLRIDLPGVGGIVLSALAEVQIQDNDFAGAPNPVNDHAFFVRQQYLDFLAREPEPSGLQAWLGVLNNCPNAFNHDAASLSARCDRNLVSSSFFRSPEFQTKGLLVYKYYAATFGRAPQYAEMIADMRRLSGPTAEEVEARRFGFMNAWADRQEFELRYPSTLTDAEFVDKLILTAGVAPGGAASRDALVAALQSRAKTRAEVVRAFVEHPAVDAAFFNRAFVATQYFGYLRRTPEEPGYTNWLNYLNANPADFYTMVNGFLYSREYELRFGQ